MGLWTQEAADMAKDMWKAGLTASLISDALKVSRSAVIGKLHRMGLSDSSRPKEIKIRKKPVFKHRPEKKKAAFTPAPDDPSLAENPDRVHPFDAAISKKQRRQTWELVPGMCKFPVGVPGSSGFFHCGGEQMRKTNDINYVYCEPHMERCYQPVMSE